MSVEELWAEIINNKTAERFQEAEKCSYSVTAEAVYFSSVVDERGPMLFATFGGRRYRVVLHDATVPTSGGFFIGYNSGDAILGTYWSKTKYTIRGCSYRDFVFSKLRKLIPEEFLLAKCAQIIT